MVAMGKWESDAHRLAQFKHDLTTCGLAGNWTLICGCNCTAAYCYKNAMWYFWWCILYNCAAAYCYRNVMWYFWWCILYNCAAAYCYRNAMWYFWWCILYNCAAAYCYRNAMCYFWWCKVTSPMTTTIRIPPYSKCSTILQTFFSDRT
jgi:hypothetical protein